MSSQVEGRHPVISTLEGTREVKQVLIAKGSKGAIIDKIAALASEKGAAVRYVAKQDLDELSSTHNHQGVIAQTAPIEYLNLYQLIELSKKGQKAPFLVVLDQIMDPHNFGAILRTADAAGVDGVIIPKRRSVDVTPTVVKVSAGAADHMPVAKVTNIARCLKQLKEEGFWIAAADGTGESLAYETDLTGPIAVVIGNEGAGVRRLVLEKSDFIVRLPMQGHVSSLNASVAAGILLFEVVRQRITLSVES